MPTSVEIQTAKRVVQSELAECDFSFNVSSVIVPPFDKRLENGLKTESQEPYRKQYGAENKQNDDDDGDDDLDISDDPNNRFLATAIVEGQIRGYILVSRMWNAVASLDDIAVDRSMRGRGVGKQLIQRALEWVKVQKLPSLRAETQSNNVMACQLYRRFGFKFGGYDEFLYSNIKGCEHEIALFWYYFVDVDKRGS